MRSAYARAADPGMSGETTRHRDCGDWKHLFVYAFLLRIPYASFFLCCCGDRPVHL